MHILPSSDGYLKLPAHEGFTYEEANAVIIPFGLEASVSYGGGTNHGPQAMIDASPELELFDESLWWEPYLDIKPVTLDIPAIATPIPAALDQLEGLVRQVLADGKFPMTFGGEHSITAGIMRPFAEMYPDLAILHFDAHADLRDGYLGEHYSHASALRRCVDDSRLTNQGHHITLVSCGIRNISASEIPFLEANRHRIHIYWGKDMKQWDVSEIVSHLKGRPVYLTFDVDGFDGSVMPATGTPEPGGLFWPDAIKIITEAMKICNVVGADINELAPIEGYHAADFLAAKLAYKILSLKFSASGSNKKR